MSDFDWHSDAISPTSRIDENYKNTQNVRRFFKEHCGEHFKFNRPFMRWRKDNVGVTMGAMDQATRAHADESLVSRQLTFARSMTEFMTNCFALLAEITSFPVLPSRATK